MSDLLVVQFCLLCFLFCGPICHLCFVSPFIMPYPTQSVINVKHGLIFIVPLDGWGFITTDFVSRLSGVKVMSFHGLCCFFLVIGNHLALTACLAQDWVYIAPLANRANPVIRIIIILAYAYVYLAYKCLLRLLFCFCLL